MTSNRDEIDRLFAAKFIGFQSLVVAILSMFSYLISKDAGVSALVGGSIAVVANFYLIRKVLRPVEDNPPEVVLISLYFGEAAKLIMVGILFFVAFKWVAPLQELKNVLIMLSCFAAVQGVHVVAPRFFKL